MTRAPLPQSDGPSGRASEFDQPSRATNSFKMGLGEMGKEGEPGETWAPGRTTLGWQANWFGACL